MPSAFVGSDFTCVRLLVGVAVVLTSMCYDRNNHRALGFLLFQTALGWLFDDERKKIAIVVFNKVSDISKGVTSVKNRLRLNVNLGYQSGLLWVRIDRIASHLIEFFSKMKWSSSSIDGSKGAPGTRPPGSKFFHFHSVFGKKNHYLGVGPPQGKSWIRHWSS